MEGAGGALKQAVQVRIDVPLPRLRLKSTRNLILIQQCDHPRKRRSGGGGAEESVEITSYVNEIVIVTGSR
jgi:hypothetical protein